MASEAGLFRKSSTRFARPSSLVATALILALVASLVASSTAFSARRSTKRGMINLLDTSLIMDIYDKDNKGYLDFDDFEELYDDFIPENFHLHQSKPTVINSSIACMNASTTFSLFDPEDTSRLNETMANSAAIYVMLMQHECEDWDICAFPKALHREYNLVFHLIAIGIVLVASAVGTGLPLIIKRRPECFPYPFVFVVGKHIGTGVLLSLGFIHLFVDAFEAFDNECLPEIFEDYPFAALLALGAGLLMHLIEQVALNYNSRDRKRSPEEAHGHAHTGAQRPVPHEKSPLINNAQIPHPHPEDEDDDEFHGHSHGHLIGSADKTISAYILEFGLTAHSVIIGITVGVAPNRQLTTLVSALAFHQFFEGMALGARLAEVGLSGVNEVILLLIYSLSAPIGIGVGIGVYDSYNGNGVTENIATGSFDAISAGIILYVAFVQMLAVEFSHDIRKAKGATRKAILFIGMWVGAGIMAIIGLWM